MIRKRLLPVLIISLAIATGFFAGRAVADQPHMHSALEHLRAAKAELELADADKGGHRQKAIAAVNNAIDQVEKGISFDRRH